MFKRRLDDNASHLLEKVGVEEEWNILDFGCGSGTYTIPAARQVGESGKVYALDVSEKSLGKVKEKADREDLENIVRIDFSEKENMGIEDEKIDLVLLIDVLQEVEDREFLFWDVFRVLKLGGIVCVYPMHLDEGEIEELPLIDGLELEEKMFEGHVLVFKKVD